MIESYGTWLIKSANVLSDTLNTLNTRADSALCIWTTDVAADDLERAKTAQDAKAKSRTNTTVDTLNRGDLDGKLTTYKVWRE